MTALADYLDDVAARRFAFGTLDCCTLMADWLVRLGWPDPMADRRGTYATFRQYRSAIRREGGLVRSCATRFAAIGLAETAEPLPGDVCLVLAPLTVRKGRAVVGPTGAIYLSTALRTVVTSDSGLVMADLKVLRAWSAGHA
ncbi:hypothetical protein JQ553_22280 [Bradyrhizobium lablabi]|nr:hypothetical protein [Bradyrhizobium lablabi]